jgi:hypothetical protein
MALLRGPLKIAHVTAEFDSRSFVVVRSCAGGGIMKSELDDDATTA